MLTNFYLAFSPACFALLGLWLVVVQLRLPEWEKPAAGGSKHLRDRQLRSYGVALAFALPGLMSALALIDVNGSAVWRVSFIVLALFGAVVMVLLAVSGYIVPPKPGHRGFHGLPGADRLGLAAYAAAMVLYVLILVMAIVGGLFALRTAAVLLTILVFVGFNAAFLLLIDDRDPGAASGADQVSPKGAMGK